MGPDGAVTFGIDGLATITLNNVSDLNFLAKADASGLLKKDFSNLPTGALNIPNKLSVGNSDGSGTQQIQFYAGIIATDPGAAANNFAIGCRTDYRPATDTSANPDGVYGTLWYNAPRNFTGAGAAGRFNAYTIAQTGGAAVNVTNLVGVYGRARHEAAGVVTRAISILADAANNVGLGSITDAIGVFIEAQDKGAKNYGIYVNNNPADGALAASPNTLLTIKTTGTGDVELWTAGSVVYRASSQGFSYLQSSNKGVARLGAWGELLETAGGYAGLAANIYSNRGTGGFNYRSTHASVGGASLLHNYAAFQTTSFLYAPAGTADAVAVLTEAMRVLSTLAASETALMLRVNTGGAFALKQVTEGAIDSGGVGFRVLRVAN